MRKILLLFFILALLSCFALGGENKFQFSIFGGINNVFKYGSENDYVMGENDFPVTPAHKPASFGASIGYFFTDNIGIELDGRYYLSSNVTLEDSSDQDTVEVDTSRHYSMTLNLFYQLSGGNFRPYLVVGGGFDKLSAKDEMYTSEYGYEIEFIALEKTTDLLAQVGGGIQYFLSSSAGAKLDVHYVLIFDDPDNISSLSIMAGAFIRF